MNEIIAKAATPGLRTPLVRRTLPVVFGIVALLFLVRFGLLGMVLGGSYIADGSPVTAQMDSEIRFLSAIAFGVGCLALWLIRNHERAPVVAVALSLTALLGGVMRVVSIAVEGVPSTVAIIALALEFIVPVATILLLAQLDTDRPAGAATEPG